MLVVIAQYRTQAGKGDKVAAVLALHRPATVAEPGCRAFVVNRSQDDGDRFVLYEQYDDEAAFEAHRASPHFKRYIEGQVVPLLAERSWERFSVVE
ncbi:MAG TPA: putative quinol monooxygenase [Gaiellales bacterium]|jgi:quinol monooxygenase YgiN|nr:putative quinol monooxygenase [Gaiellales bacterium]